MNNWIRVDERLPHAFESGKWDGLRSDLVLFATKDEKYHIGHLYAGFMDGSNFSDWCDKDDWIINEPVVAWMPIPDLY